MHLQSLELLGFKSFADKMILNFHEGITAIVGPNGCGKSNVLDAVRWVLGEQSAKSLRGEEMADVIFNGSDARKPVGFAEVSVTFTDCAKELAIDWHDVRATRRVYRDGNSEYLLNKAPCRLRDIQNLFADTGIGRTAYSMMEQGKIDMILSSRPEDRRAIFEEAAGITKYKTQKREALRKLEATEANLLRIGDVIKEVKRQIGSLQRQAGKARRYQALHADLRVLDTHYSHRQLDSLRDELAACRDEINRLSESEHTTRAKVDNGENELAEERRTLDRIDIEIADSRAAMQRLESEIAAHGSRIEFNSQRAQELAELIERARADIAEAEAKHKKQTAEIHKTNSLIEKADQLLKQTETELGEVGGLTKEIQKNRGEHSARLQDLQLTVSKSETRIAALEEELAGTTARREMTAAQTDRLAAEIRKSADARAKIVDRIAGSLKLSADDRRRLEELFANSQSAETNLRRHQELLVEAEKNLATAERALAERQSRLEVLRQLNEEGAGLAEGSQALLKGIDDPARFRPAITGSLVSQLDVDPKFISAIEAALGRNLHAVILKNPEVAQEIILRLTKNKLGQAALFIPQIGPPSDDSTKRILPQDAIAWAVDKVAAPKSLELLVRQLLGNVAVFSDLERALKHKQTEPALAMATITGEFISAEGIIFGGSNEVRVDSLLERKTQISGLAKEETALTNERDMFLAKRDAAKRALEMASLLQRELGEAEHKIDNLQSEKAALERQIAAADERIARLQNELRAAHDQFSKQKSELASFEAAQKQVASREEEVTEKLNQLRLVIATEHQRRENLIAQRESMNARETELAELIARRRSDISMYENKLATQAEESRESQEAIEKQTARRTEVEANAAKIAEQRAARFAAISHRETELRRWRDSLGELQSRRGHQQVHETQLQMKINNLAEHVQRHYHVDLRAFTPDQPTFGKVLRAQLKRGTGTARSLRADAGVFASVGAAEGPVEEEASDEGVESETRGRVRSPETVDLDFGQIDVQKLIEDLTQQLDNMGPVNLDAVHEYDELEERYRFLENQNNDLTASRSELLDVIAQINSTTRKLFSETFAQVRVNFREMFAELFGGGRADLSLLDETDPLNCGIEISAKPPGKQLQSVSLLSGGERSMVAVALLFAIYMVRPSPFCILDEVDAAMDEGNINRFIRVLERFLKQSQFIIMTHNKRTIAKADVLYGVTMEERGVSKLVGVKLTEPRQTSTEAASNGGEPNPRQRRLALATR